MAQKKIVIGMDGGGSQTRAAAADLEGNIIAYVEAGGANPHHNQEAKQNIRQAIKDCIAQARCHEQDVAALAAGLAGIDQESDYTWAQDFIRLPGLSGEKMAVSDARAAQIGALNGEPGIIAISGTGSVVYGVNEAGKELRNYDFHQYAASAARHLSYEAVFRVIAGAYTQKELPLVEQILAFWKVQNVSELAQLGAKGFLEERTERNRQFGAMAPIITAAAEEGYPLARSVCDVAAEAAAVAIKLVGSNFRSERIAVSFIGSVLRTPYMYGAVQRFLEEGEQQVQVYEIKEPAFTPVIGALFLAYEQLQMEVTDAMKARLATNPLSKY
ncbi:BadF/BadG/BcrA/BcrD ATPase family protein [Marinicrinis lubricantis]|uniref:BadF/BadG/BcrA/BcrD ATPase family protein n=1 Tax=Marinicrinis lubricantis TaxID=2086470 RepID=A0ABW1IP19_9BACL